MKRVMNKKGLEMHLFGKFAIGIGVLVIMIGAYLIFSGKLTGTLEFVRNWLRFGR